jgi:MFS family permease
MATAPQTEARASAGSLARLIQAHRTLDVYPTGRRRWGLLLVALAAAMIGNLEVTYSALLPLWLPSLHFSAKEFGYFLAIGVVLSSISTLIGGPLADRYGRIVIIDICLGAIVALMFCNLLMTDFKSFVVVRAMMTIVAGMTIPALASLMRDLSPRLSRGAAYGLFAAGAGGGSWVWTFIPGITLPYFPTWQDQTILMGIFVAVLYVIVLIWLKDISPDLRLRVVESEAAARDVAQTAQHSSAPASARAAYAMLIYRWDVWTLIFGGVAGITVNLMMQTFGPLIYVQVYKYSAAQASRIVSYYFFMHTVGYFAGGCVSDWLRVRKPFGIAMAAIMSGMLAWWALNFSHVMSPVGLVLFNLVLGITAASAYTPLAAFYSEYIEDISPAVQATGWSLLMTWFRVWFALIGIAQPRVAQRFGWDAWIWVVVASGVVYIVCWLTIRGHWRPSIAPNCSIDESA